MKHPIENNLKLYEKEHFCGAQKKNKNIFDEELFLRKYT